MGYVPSSPVNRIVLPNFTGLSLQDIGSDGLSALSKIRKIVQEKAQDFGQRPLIYRSRPVHVGFAEAKHRI